MSSKQDKTNGANDSPSASLVNSQINKQNFLLCNRHDGIQQTIDIKGGKSALQTHQDPEVGIWKIKSKVSIADSIPLQSINGQSSVASSQRKKIVSFNFKDFQDDLSSKKAIKRSILKRTYPEMTSPKTFRSQKQNSFNNLAQTTSVSSQRSLASVFSFRDIFSTLKLTPNTNSFAQQQTNKYQQWVECLARTDRMYTDSIFSPSVLSVAYRSQSTRFKAMQWVRLADLHKDKGVVLYRKQPRERRKVVPGYYQTSNICGAMNVVKSIDGFLQSVFYNNQISKNGIYCLKLFLHGVEKTVTIDDLIPVVSQNGVRNPAFINVGDGDTLQIWPFLLQKAYAKVFSTYESLLESQSVSDWISTLVGHPLSPLNVNDARLKVICFQEPETHFVFLTKQGQWAHSQLCKTTSQQPQFLIQNRRCPLSSIGEFYQKVLTFSPRQRHLSRLHQVKSANRQPVDLCVYKFSLTRYTSLEVSLWQKDIKLFRGLGYKYSPLRMILATKEDGSEGCRWVTGTYSDTKCGLIEANLAAGEHYLILIVSWVSKPFQMNFRWGCDNAVVDPQKMGASESQRVLEEVGGDAAQRFGKCKQVTDRICIYKYVDLGLGLLMQSIYNQHRRQVASVRKTYQIIKGDDRVVPLTGNIKGNVLVVEIPKTKNVSAMVIARNIQHSRLLLQYG